MEMKFTTNEIAAMKLCLNYDDRATQLDDNFSNAGPTDFAKALGWTMHQVGGLVASLEKKGVAWLDNRDGDFGVAADDVDMHIVWLTEKGVNEIFDIIEAEAK